MARFRLVNIAITEPFDVDFTAGDLVTIMWNSSTEEIEVELNGSPYTTAGTLLGELGSNFNTVIGISSVENGYSIAGYSFCDGADLVWFRMLNEYPEYPFFEKVITTDSPVCDVGGGAVCDIHFVGPPTVVHSTDQSTGGSVTVSAVSSNGTVRYGLRNSPYADLTNTTGVFTGMIPGEWTIYAKDANDCTALVTVRVLFKPTEAEHYRFTWSSLQIGSGTSRDARVRIYEREYVGSVVEVDYAEVSPFTLTKPKQGAINDKFFPIHPTSAALNFTSIRDYQYLPLFTQDDKRYRVVYEVDEGGGFSPIWQGFIVPSVYREDFKATPYFVEILCTDNLKTLETLSFTDDEGALLSGQLKLIKVISIIMKKTGLSLKIRSGINIFEANHNTAATDDPLDQTYMDVACYREGKEPFDCWKVLESILRPFGARIFQYDNSWIIEEIDRAVDEYAYRVFDANGNYESNSTFNPIIEIKNPALTDRAALVDRDHSMEVIPAYGKISLTSSLNYVGSIVAGGFEQTDLLSPESESFVVSQGVFKSEEGFRDWTLRMPSGISGVSFGRVVVGNRGDSSRTGFKTPPDEDKTRSVGAFYYNPQAWTGNIRDAYIESAVKDYDYGPGDELKFYFEYSTPAKPEYEFMVLRTMIKIGSYYLQPDLTWDTTEAIYRAYPRVSNSLQKFELSLPVPETETVVQSTIQVRIYYYASGFYDYGLPSDSNDPADGTDGIADLKDFPTAGKNYDYRLDMRREFTINSLTSYTREFYELRFADVGENILGGIIAGDDYDSDTNPRIWYRLKMINIQSEEINANRRGLDLKFYVDNVALDALINGQPPPEEDTISLTISKYIDENLEIQLYNFDVPDITNARNMYNNYFRLSDGTPTSAWTRSGVPELLKLQEILLKVLGGNHSAPTFRLTGSFINEFSRIGINNYLKLTKPGSNLTASNTEFDTDLTGWLQSALPFGTGTWVWTADNDGSVEASLTGTDSSKKIYQNITHDGGYIELTVNINVVPSAGNTREDIFWALFYNDGDIIHTEKLKTFMASSSESTDEFTHIAFAPSQVDGIGFFIQNISGSGDIAYQVGEFTPAGKDIVEIYQISDYLSNERLNTYSFELMQLNKGYITLSGIDTGGTGQAGGGTTGRAHSSGHSSAFN